MQLPPKMLYRCNPVFTLVSGNKVTGYDYPTFSNTVNPEIFYVIKDIDGNYYKMEFTRINGIIAECAGEISCPGITYELLK